MGNTLSSASEFTPLTALLFAEISQAVGLPPGVLNVLTGDGDTGAALGNTPTSTRSLFTGSTDVGRIIRQATAGHGKRLSLELGGKSPFVVFDDRTSTAPSRDWSMRSGSTRVRCAALDRGCWCRNRLSGHCWTRSGPRMSKLRVGDPLDKAIDIGAIVAPESARAHHRAGRGRPGAGANVWQPADACPVTAGSIRQRW